MTKLVLNDINSLANTQSAKQALNDNFTAIEAAIENTLSRDGTLPNQMEADIDLNSNDLLNAGRVDAAQYLLNGVPLEQTVAYANKSYQLFDGTGVQTDFLLSEDPVSLGNLEVSIKYPGESGLELLRPGLDYNFTGATLVFVTPPPAGVKNILVRYDQALPTGVTSAEAIMYTPPSTGVLGTIKSFLDLLWTAGANAGSALIRYLQLGTGAVPLPVQDRIQAIEINAIEFGVVADGVTVCDTQMATAIAAVPDGCTLKLPRGTIKLNNTLSADNISIEGHGVGTVLDFSGLSASEDAVVFGASFTAPPKLRNVQVYMNGGGRDGVVFQGADHPTLDEVHIYRPGRDGVVLEPSGAFMWIENTRVKNTKVIEPLRDGLRMTLANHNATFINLGEYDGFEVRDAARYVINVEQGHDLDSINQHTFISCELEQNRNVPTDPAVFFNRTNAAHPLPFASQFVFLNCTFEDLAFPHTGPAINSNVFATGVDEVTLINCIVYNYGTTFGTGIRRGYELSGQIAGLRGETPFHLAASTSGGINESVGGVAMEGYNSIGSRKRYTQVEGVIVDSTNASEDAKVRTSVMSAGVLQPASDVDFPITASDTSYIIAVNRAGVVALSRVTIGAADSGGAGFRVLRVPN